MKKPIFTGASVAIVTPFREDGAIDYDRFAQLIEFQIAGGTNSITVCGTTGESATMTDEEHKECIRFCVEQVAGRIPVIAGTGSNDTAYALQLSQYAQSVGADGLLLVTPYYNKTSQAGLVAHYRYLADRLEIPMIVYNVPSRTGVSFTAESYARLAAHPLINGVKEASGNFSLIAQTRALCGDELNIWSGNDDQVVPIIALGGQGVISVVSNVAPKVMADMCKLALAGDFAGATKLQLEYLDLANDLFLEVNPIPVKAAVGMMGLCSSSVRMPLCDMSEGPRAKLEASLRRHGLIG